MQEEVEEPLQQLAKIAVEGPAANEALVQATSIIRQATDAAEAMLVYAEDKEFLTCNNTGAGPETHFTLGALTTIQRQLAQAAGPVAFNLIGQRVEDFTSALSHDQREFLALPIPTSESAAEMCILRGVWEHNARARILRFAGSATPSLAIILERLLNADRGRRLAEQLHTLANAAQVLTESEDVGAALTELATAIAAATGSEYRVNIDLYDPTTGRFVARAMTRDRHGSGSLGQAWGATLNPDQPDPWNVQVMQALRPVLRPDMQNDPIYPEHVRKFFSRALLRSSADFPLLFQGEFLGVMAFVCFKPHTFAPEEVAFLQGFVSQVAVALKALQMHEEVERYAQEIKRSADQYIATTNLTGDVICKMDKRGMWTFLNDAACQFYGKPREELLGTDSRTFLDPDDVEPTAQAIRQMIKDKKPVSGFVNRHVTPTGIRVVEWNGYPLFDEEKQYAGIQITGRDITERKQMEEERERLHAELEVRALTDSLTGLYNHAHFFQRLAEEIERSKRYDHGFAVLMMDVDNFKRFNDSRGHQAGDEVLYFIAESVRSAMRRSDLAFRYGGDEFAAILPHADPAKARAAVGSINRRITKRLNHLDDGAAPRLSLSAGVACFPHDGSTADELVKRADTDLYSAKWAGRAHEAMVQAYAIEQLTPPADLLREIEAGGLSTAVGAVATTLRELGVPDILAELNLHIIADLGALAEIRDPSARGHQERTSDRAAALAAQMGLPPEQVRLTRFAGLLHDLGKAGISRQILNKPGKLTEEEFARIKEHPLMGSVMILSEIETLQRLVPVIRHHHERFDGNGYPDRLAGQDIPLAARILAVVDAFDAMTHQRPYRNPMSLGEARAELERCAGTQFDPMVVEAYQTLLSMEDEGLTAPSLAADRRGFPTAVQ